METGEYGLTRGTYFVARHVEVVTVDGLMLRIYIVMCVFSFW